MEDIYIKMKIYIYIYVHTHTYKTIAKIQFSLKPMEVLVCTRHWARLGDHEVTNQTF